MKNIILLLLGLACHTVYFKGKNVCECRTQNDCFGGMWLAKICNQWEAKPKSNHTLYSTCMRNFSGALRKSQVISSNSDWFILLLAPVMIGQSNMIITVIITLVLVFQRSLLYIRLTLKNLIGREHSINSQ